MFSLGEAKTESVTSPLETAVSIVNHCEGPENHIIFEDGVLYTSPAKDEQVTVVFAEEEIQEAQNMLDIIASSPLVGGTQYFWTRKRENWTVIKNFLTP